MTDTRGSVVYGCDGREAHTQENKCVLNSILSRFVREQQPNAIE
jgi:hypothetical protein